MIDELIGWLNENRAIGGPYHYETTQKYYKIIRCHGAQQSVHSFVARVKFANKCLGIVEEGMIFKPASWNAPARKHRGNLFDKDSWEDCFGAFSVRYLK